MFARARDAARSHNNNNNNNNNNDHDDADAPPQPAFRGIYNGNAGWVKSADAMVVLAAECRRLGVRFASGAAGTVVGFVRAADGQTVTGVRTQDGREWRADKVVVAAGAYSDTLLDFRGQLEAVSFASVSLNFVFLSFFLPEQTRIREGGK